jgi:hypothetical protein
MRAWSLLSAQNPIWHGTGFAVLAFAMVGTGIFIYLGPKPLKAKSQGGTIDGGIEGRIGTYTEQLGQSRFLLAYDSITGQEATLQLKGVHGRLEEPATLYLMNSPIARKAGGIWSLDGPMDIEAREPAHQQTLIGKGRIENPEVGLKWDHGTWTGMSTLVWEDLQGQGRGRWTLPPGWRRELDGRFVVENKPVHWDATGEGAMRALDAQSLWVTLGFGNGRMEQVQAALEGGRIQAQAAEMSPDSIHWLGPIHFQRDDGWIGEAESGLAPRSAEGGSLDKVDLKSFKAHRAVIEGTETIQAEGARWTPAGIRAEGDVRWEQPRDGDPLSLRAPRLLLREAAGEDLPKDLPIGDGRAEGIAVLAWGNRTLSSPRMDVRRVQRTWRIQAPALGKSEQGTFSAGAGMGNPTRWEFEGPIRANVVTGGDLRGDRLVWEESTWTLTGRPATWNGLRERLSGPKLVQKADLIQFPDGVGGSFAAPEGDVVIRADRGESQTSVAATFLGRVDGQGQGWHLQADRVTVALGPDNQVKKIVAKGSVSLRGKINEGRGEYLELDLVKSVARWQGLVKGSAEVQP